jgi:hypothetical protein
MRPKLSELIVDGYFCNGGQWVKYGVDDICPLSQSGIYVGSDMPQLNRARRLGAGGALQCAALLFLLLCALPTTAQNTLTVLIFGTATVTSSPAGISCTVTGGTGCSANLPSGAVTLSETPGTGQTFYGWTGGCTGSGLTCTFSLTANTAVGAAFQCGPPIYPCSATSKSPVGTLTPPFSTSTPFNTVVFSPLNPTLDPITRFIDRNVVQYGTSTNLSTAISSGNLTVSGSDNDLNTSLHAQYVMVRANGGPNWIFQTSTLNGAMQNATNGGENPSLGVYSPAFSFSRVSEKVFYYFTGSSLQQATIVPGTPMTDTVTANAGFPFNIDNCPAAGTGTPTWLSFLGVAANDSVFMFAAAWTGGQGYGHLVFAYSPTLGCSTLDLAPNGTSSVSGNWYTWCTSNCSAATPAGTETACYDPYYATGSGIHDVYTGQDGTMINIDGGCWNGNTIESQAFWQINTGNVLSGIGNETIGGHKSVGYTHILYTNDPTPNSRTISPLTTGNLAAYTNMTAPPTYGASGSGGYHGGWPSDLNTNDLNYWIYETACSPSGYECANYLTPNAYQNEIFGISPASAGPAIVRFAPSYNSGESTYFSCGNGIGFPSQDGQWWFWIADGLLNLGLDGNGKPLCSVFAVHLDSTGPPPPGIYSPVKGSALTGNSATFQWGGYPGATAYWLDVGKENGGDEYSQSGSLSSSTYSQTVNSLPTNGSSVVATWYHLLNGTWTPTYYTYTAFGGNSSQGVITSPVPSSTLSGGSVTFSWTAGVGAPAYWLDAGTEAGGDEYYQSGNLGNVLTIAVSGLPTNGSTVYVTLYSLVNGQWLSNVYTYTAFGVGKAAIYSPASPSNLAGGSVTFQWNAVAGAYAYWLDVGTVAGADQYYQSGSTTNTSATVTGLPTNGTAVVATLYTEFSSSGPWLSSPFTYTAFSNSSQGVLTTPPPNTSTPLSGTTVTFTWNLGSGPTAYWLDVGNEPDGDEYYQSGSLAPGSGSTQSLTASGLPSNGNTIYVTLYSQIGGQWSGTSYTYVASSSGLATMISPVGGTVQNPGTLTGCCLTFQWTQGTTVTAYWVDVGNEAKGDEYYQSGSLSTTSTTVNNLPGGGATVYVTLYSQIGGTWSNNVYVYTSN